MPARGYVEISKEACKGCELCIKECPVQCLALNKKDTNTYGLHYAYLEKEELCTGCQNCAVICPDAAITVYRKTG